MLTGRTGFVAGVSNKHSLGWAVAKAWKAAGADVIIGVQSERFEKGVARLQTDAGWEEPLMVQCDVVDDDSIASAFEQVGAITGGKLDMLMHSLAFAPATAIKGRVVDVTREDYAMTQDISAYSFIALAREAAPMMKDGGSMMALSYLGSERLIDNYGIMGPAKASLESITRALAGDLGPQGIRVNCLSPGPVNTLAARGIPNFRTLLKHVAETAPLRRHVEPAEVGGTAAFLASDAGSGITGQVLYIDCGHGTLGPQPGTPSE
eukprot:PLAT1987.1.p1 GENE.PLAT1987.1~~PLAT1987.1.p1  ORF type:complete len:264 (+),score=92.33 PLAT1987.1:52-843(+)